MTTPVAYFNGCILPQNDARLPLHDAGFVWGATVTDLCRTFRHRLFRLSDHIARFRRSCQSARVPQPVADEELTRIAKELAGRNAHLLGPGQDLALVMFATPGPVGYYAGLSGGPGDGPPTLGMHTFPLPFGRYLRLFREGARLVTPSTRHVPAQCVDPRIKMRSRMHWWLAEQEAHDVDPGAAALLLDAAGHVTETAGANFLVVREGVVLSPPRESVLGGISLRVVEELCGRLEIRFEERSLAVSDCLFASEAMLASTPYGLAGVSRINGTALPWPGTAYQRLLAAWGELVGIDIRSQIEACATS
jgi:branched-subunit amino acid aminotransferase/4-amino-4-deoxychorismate lyase